MRKEKKKRAGYTAVVYGTIMAIGIYLIAIAGLAYIITRGMLKEENLLIPILAVCMIATWSSGIWTIKFSASGERGYAIIVSVIFSCIVLLVSEVLEGTVIWWGSGICLLMATLLGSVLACFTVKRRKKKGKRLSK